MSVNIELWNDGEENDPRRHYQRERSRMMHPTLYISGVPDNINNDGLYNLFSKFGNVLSANTIPSKKIANSQIGFVSYDSMDSAQKAIQNMNLKPPFNFQVKMKLPKADPPTFIRDSELMGQKTGDRFASDYGDGRANTEFPDSQRGYNVQKNIRENNDFGIGRNQTQANEFDNFKGVKGENSYLPRQSRKHITWGGAIDVACDIPKSEPKFRNYHNFPDESRYENRQEKQFSNTAQRGMRARNYAYQNAGADAGYTTYYPRKNYHAIYRNMQRPDSECSSEESYREFGAEADVENADILEEELDGKAIIAITITEKGRSFALAPQLAPVTEVTTYSTQTSFSKRREFSGPERQEYDVERDYERPNHRRQFPEVSYNNQGHGMIGKQDRNFYSNDSRQAHREYCLPNMGCGDVKKPEPMSPDSEFIKQSNSQRDNKYRYQDRKDGYQPRVMNNPIEARAFNTRQHMSVTAAPLPTTKVDQLPIRTPFKCVICHAENPDVLWIQRDVKELAGLTKQLTGLLKPPDNDFIPRINGVYLIEYNSSWYRGKIVQVNRNGKYGVLLVDYGKIVGDISIAAMALLSHTNLNKPYFATKCKVCPDLMKKYNNAKEIFEILQKAEITVIIERMDENLVIVTLDIPNEITSLTRSKPQHHSLKMKTHISDSRATVSDLPEIQFKIKDLALVVVLYIESAKHIAVCAEKNLAKFSELSKLLTNVCAASTRLYTPIKGELVFAKFEDDCWYRAEIMEICPDNSARVFFIDYGNMEKVFFKDIQPITPEALKYPQFGLIVSLYKAPESSQLLSNMVDKKFQMKVVNDRVNPMLVEFPSEPKAQNYFVSQHLKRAKVELGPIKATFGVADDDAIYIIPSFNQDLISALKRFNETTSIENASFEPRIGELCLAFFRDSWSRAACVTVILNPKKFVVFMFDYGSTEEIDSVFLRPYTEEFVDFPTMAVKCVVEGYPSEKTIRDKMQSLECIDDDIEGDIIAIRKDYVEMKLI